MAGQTEKCTNMNTTKVQLPDGRLLKIEGRNAHSVAKLITNHYLGAGHVAQTSETDEPLEMAEMTFDSPADPQRQNSESTIRQLPVLNDGDELVLNLPKMF